MPCEHTYHTAMVTGLLWALTLITLETSVM